MHVHVSSALVEFDEQSRLDFTGVFIVKQNQSEVGIYFNSGLSVVAKSIESFLTYEISIPQKFKGQYHIASARNFRVSSRSCYSKYFKKYSARCLDASYPAL